MDDVQKLLSEIKNDKEIMKVKFTGLLDKTANMLEKHGFGVTEAFLLEKQSQTELREQSKALLKILEKIEEYPNISSDRKTARLIIKVVESLQFRRRQG